jgi:hypothetical protein
MRKLFFCLAVITACLLAGCDQEITTINHRVELIDMVTVFPSEELEVDGKRYCVLSESDLMFIHMLVQNDYLLFADHYECHIKEQPSKPREPECTDSLPQSPPCWVTGPPPWHPHKGSAGKDKHSTDSYVFEVEIGEYVFDIRNVIHLQKYEHTITRSTQTKRRRPWGMNEDRILRQLYE